MSKTALPTSSGGGSSLEDETGIANVIVTPSLFDKSRAALVGEPFLLIEGVLRKQEGAAFGEGPPRAPVAARRRGGIARLPLTRQYERLAAGATATLQFFVRRRGHRLEEREVVRQAQGGTNPQPPLRGHVCGRDRKAAIEIEAIRRVG